MGVAVLGPVVVDGTGASLGPRDRVVLAALVMAGGRVVSAERLSDALWEDCPPPSWNKVVQGCVVRLRKVLGQEAIETSATGYRLALPSDDVDAHRFEAMVSRARELVALGQPDRASYVLAEALDLWRGAPLEELDAWDAARGEITRLTELRMEAEELRIEAALRAGQYPRVLAEAQSRVREAPLRERRWALLALAQYQAGRQADALRTLRQVRSMLVTELGVDPGPDLTALEEAILRQDPSLVADATLPDVPAPCPYLGLMAYDTADADSFFGRDTDIAACVERLAAVGVLAVVGPSGCGKSSLLRAGIVAALNRQGHRTIVITPGRRPLDALSRLPSHVETGSTLVVDQCEEAVGPGVDPREAAQFFTILTEHAERGRLVLALRADRLGAISAHTALARMIERGLYLLGPMSEDDLRAAIEGPAHQAGLLLEPGLADLLVREVEGEPGALPLLSHALRRTWERREGRSLTVAGYRQTGGIREAVAQSAEEVYERVNPDERLLLRDLLLRLVSPTGNGEPIRSRVPRRLLATDEQRDELIELLVGARLVTSDEGVVELAHEALARAWPRLRHWLDDDVDGQRIQRHLITAADSWDSMGRPDSELYRGVRLAEALEWRTSSAPEVTPVERAFLDAGEQAEESARRRDREQARRQMRVNRRLRVLLAGVAVLSLGAAGAGAMAAHSADRADRSAARADRTAAAADARRVGAQALLEEDPARALLLATEGVRLHDSADTRANLLAALSRSPGLLRSGRQESPLARLEVRRDGNVVAISNPVSGVTFHDSQTLGLVGTFNAGPASDMAFRPEGFQLAVSVGGWSDLPSLRLDPEPVRLIDCNTFTELPTQLKGMPPRSHAADLGYSADGTYLAALFNRFRPGEVSPHTSTVVVWDISQGDQPVVARIAAPKSASAVALSPDGTVVYVGTQNPPSVTAYSAVTRKQLMQVPLSGASLQLSPDGRLLAVGDHSDVVLLDASSGTEVRRFRGHSEAVTALRFSDGGALLASGSADRSAMVWDVETGERRERLVGHYGAVAALGFSPDGGALFTTGTDRTVLQWDLGGYSRFIPRVGSAGLPVPSMPIASPDGAIVAYTSPVARPGRAGSAALRFRRIEATWNVASSIGALIDTGHGRWLAAAWRPDLKPPRLATTGDDGVVRVWDPAEQTAVSERRVADGAVTGLDYTSDGRRLLLAEAEGTVRLVDADTLSPTVASVDVGRQVLLAFVSPSGKRAVVLTRQGRFVVVDLVKGTVEHDSPLGFVPTWADFSPDGARIAFAGSRGQLALLDAKTGNWLRRPSLGHKDQTLRVAFAPSGTTFVSGSADGRVSLWDGHTGQRLGTLQPGPSAEAVTADFLEGSPTVLITGVDGTTYRWDTDPASWLKAACDIAGRNLSRQEWRETFGERPYHRTC